MPGASGMMTMMNMMSQAGMTPMMAMMGQAGTTPMVAMMGPNGMMTLGMMGGPDQSSVMMGGRGMGLLAMPLGMSPGLADGGEHIEGRIAFLKTELKITEAQAKTWDAFADALRKAVPQARQMRSDAMGMAAQTGDLPARLARQEQMLRNRLELMHREAAPLLALYAVLTEEQKRTADQLLAPGGMGL
jgi:LTXXQ motif family protein